MESGLSEDFATALVYSAESTAADCGAALMSRAERRLGQAGLSHWIRPALWWASRFDGVERWTAELEFTPARCVLKLGLRYWRARPRQPTDQAVAAALAHLPFTYVRAKWPIWATGERESEWWNPLLVPFSDFASRHAAADGLLVWEGTVQVVAPHVAQKYLLDVLAGAWDR
jgi:hypothetical protein